MATVFDIGREMVSPHNCGKAFGEIPMAEILRRTTALTEREKNHPHAKYFYQEMEPVQPEHDAAFNGGPMDPMDCYMPSEVARHMNTAGYDKIENGYGVMENGVGFAACKIDQPGITDEMIRYFCENFARFDDLYYKVWSPGAHLLHYTNGAIEDFGWGMLNMHMTFTADLSELGFQEDKILENDPRCINVLTATGFSTPLDRLEAGEEVMSMFSYARDTGNGHELRIRYWVGLGFDDNGNVFIKKRNATLPAVEKARLMMMHCIKEYRNQARLVREFWNERT